MDDGCAEAGMSVLNASTVGASSTHRGNRFHWTIVRGMLKLVLVLASLCVGFVVSYRTIHVDGSSSDNAINLDQTGTVYVEFNSAYSSEPIKQKFESEDYSYQLCTFPETYETAYSDMKLEYHKYYYSENYPDKEFTYYDQQKSEWCTSANKLVIALVSSSEITVKLRVYLVKEDWALDDDYADSIVGGTIAAGVVVPIVVFIIIVVVVICVKNQRSRSNNNPAAQTQFTYTTAQPQVTMQPGAAPVAGYQAANYQPVPQHQAGYQPGLPAPQTAYQPVPGAQSQDGYQAVPALQSQPGYIFHPMKVAYPVGAVPVSYPPPPGQPYPGSSPVPPQPVASAPPAAASAPPYANNDAPPPPYPGV